MNMAQIKEDKWFKQDYAPAKPEEDEEDISSDDEALSIEELWAKLSDNLGVYNSQEALTKQPLLTELTGLGGSPATTTATGATVMAALQRCETVDLKKAAPSNGVQAASRSLLRSVEGSVRDMRRLMIATVKMVRNYSKVVEMTTEGDGTIGGCDMRLGGSSDDNIR
ncbi:hypothetical protein B296_00035626 [Ensete ventricosum]|uniref:Uncharacterized protein n=1 Tax=Ensete ventricosum TaxID=4639 RepID=A0A426XV41_ENSVE|nr:hypothetical protein B296_00035626 [Ensete ventricosum]